MRFSKARSVLSISAFEELVEGQILFAVASGVEDGEPCFVSFLEGVAEAVVVDFGHGVQVLIGAHSRRCRFRV